VRLTLHHGTTLVADLGAEHRVLSSAVLGGGLARARSWLNVTVPHDYARTDPEADLAERAATLQLPRPTVGMLTAADVRAHHHARHGFAHAVATVGIHHALAAAGTRPRLVAPVGTINVLVVLDRPLTDAALAGALQTAVEAKSQALATAGVPAINADVPATGTATDSIAVAAPLGPGLSFAGPATAVGADLAQAVHAAVLAGAQQDLVRIEALA
jgi:adenosylcobinamide hydrolase